mgnify:CR=1 FL=1
MIKDLHHIQLAMPEGGEGTARAFYGSVLGFSEIQKPAVLQVRGGVWFAIGRTQVHLGVETPFHPARKAHPAFQVDRLSAMTDLLDQHDVPYQSDQDLPGIKRVYIADPFGNRIELLEVIDSA